MTKYTMTTRPSSYHMATATKAMMLEKHIAMLHEEGKQQDKWTAVTSATKPAKAARILETATTVQLVEIHEMLSHMMFDNQDPISKEQFIARHWVEDELRSRDCIAYDCWLDDEEPGVSPRKYFIDYWMFEEIW